MSIAKKYRLRIILIFTMLLSLSMASCTASNDKSELKTPKNFNGETVKERKARWDYDPLTRIKDVREIRSNEQVPKQSSPSIPEMMKKLKKRRRPPDDDMIISSL